MIEKEENPLISSKSEIEDWVKEALEAWFDTQESSAYWPFRDHFRLNLEPYQVLFSIYQQLPKTRSTFGLGSSPAARFRSAISRLLMEPEIYKRNHFVYFELLRLGSEIGSKEMLASLTMMLESRLLPICLVFEQGDDRKQVNILSETVDSVLRAGFVGRPMLRFLQSTLPHIQDGYLSADTIMLAFARLDRRRWAKHASRLALELTDYFDENVHPMSYRAAKASFRKRLLGIVGKENYYQGLDELMRQTSLRTLNWLITPEYAQEQNQEEVHSPTLRERSVVQDLKKAGKKSWTNISLGELLQA